MPDIENLMQEWPGEFEEALKEVGPYCHTLTVIHMNILQTGIPSADLDCDLANYADILCGT